jgi:hypothetical protein
VLFEAECLYGYWELAGLSVQSVYVAELWVEFSDHRESRTVSDIWVVVGPCVQASLGSGASVVGN